MSSLSIQTKFTIVSVVAVVIIAIAAALNFMALRTASDQAVQAQVAATLLRQHMDGDMMHDAIRADVLAATLGVKQKDAKMVEDARDGLKEHGDRFLENLRKNMALDLPRDINAELVKEEPALKAYTEQATKYIETALADSKAGTNNTESLLPQFEDAFEVLEKSQGEVGDKVEAFFTSIKDAQVAESASAIRLAIILAVVTVLVTALVPVISKFTLFTPQAALVDTMQALARGTTNVHVPFTDRTDEIGAMAETLLVFQKNADEKIRLEREQGETKKADEAARRQAVLALADRFESRIGELVRSVAAATTELKASAESMSATTAQVKQQAEQVNATSQQTAQNISTVAAATEELSQSFAGINQRAENSITIVNEAVSQTIDTSSKVKNLEDAARRIGEVVKLISGVAEQTNLLALNATIEAARAGDAGKGFAVVASEVKALATQTGKATGEVETQIRAIEAAVRESTTAMNAVNSSINKVNDISSDIAAAVKEQSAATAEIAQNVLQGSKGSGEIQSNISGVLHATHEVGAASDQVLAAANELNRSGEVLAEQVDAFLREIRS